jgi:signal transduction histidine kinase
VKLLRPLINRLSLSSFRRRILVIALLPALLTEFGLVAYFTMQTLATGDTRCMCQQRPAASPTLPIALASRHRSRACSAETENSLSFARVTALAFDATGDAFACRRACFRRVADIRSSLHAAISPASDLLGHAEIGVSFDQINAFKRDTLIHAMLVMLVALGVTSALAWRLSNRLASQLRHVGSVVGRLARNDLDVRTHLPPDGEVGALAAGVNHMAEALQTHRDELEMRVREATADLAAKMDMAERAIHAKSRFFAAASHDLRHPLHALTLFGPRSRHAASNPKRKPGRQNRGLHRHDGATLQCTARHFPAGCRHHRGSSGAFPAA